MEDHSDSKMSKSAEHLEDNLTKVLQILAKKDELNDEDVDTVSDKLEQVQCSLDTLIEDIDKVTDTNRVLKERFVAIVDVLDLRLGHSEDTPDEKVTEKDYLSGEEREKLSQHIPNFVDEEETDIKLHQRFKDQKIKLVKLRENLTKLTENTQTARQDLTDLRHGLNDIVDCTKETRKASKVTSKAMSTSDGTDTQKGKTKSSKGIRRMSSKSAGRKTPKDGETRTKPEYRRRISSRQSKNIDHKELEDKQTEGEEDKTQKGKDPKQKEKTLAKNEEEKKRTEMEQEKIKQQKEEKLRQRQQKEQKQREETEKRRKLIEEQKKREEEQRKEFERQLNPDNWSTISYSVDKTEDILDTGIGCIMKVEAGCMIDNQLQCSSAQCVADIGPLEDRLSNVICLKSSDGDPVNFRFPAIVSIPYLHDDVRQPVVYVKEGRGMWSAVETETTEQGDMKMASFRRRRIKDLKCVVGLALSGLTRYFDSEGGYIRAVEDPRVIVDIPENTFLTSGQVGLHVIPQETVSKALSRLEDRDLLEDVSSLVAVRFKGEALAPLSLRMQLISHEKGPFIGKRVHVMTSHDGHHWSHTEPKVSMDPDKVTMPIEQDSQRVLLVRTRGYISPRPLVQITQNIVEKLKEFPSTFIVCQKKDDPEQLYVHCCVKHHTKQVLSEAQQQGYVIDPFSCRSVFIRDGTQLAVTFSPGGNIDFTEDTSQPVIFTFLSKLDLNQHQHQHQIKVKNVFCQKQHTSFRGKLQVFDVSCGDKKDGSVGRLLCETPVTLPKAAETQENQPVSRNIHFFYGVEPLTEDYVKELADNLADDWNEMAPYLGLHSATIQHIKQRNMDLEDRAFDMLRIWYMKSKQHTNKVEQLLTALKAIRKHKKAEDLEQRYKQILQQKRIRIKEQLFTKLAKRISADPKALEDWKGILRSLRIKDDVLTEIEGATNNRISCLQNGLTEWLHRRGDRANAGVLVTVLRTLGYHAAAEQVSFCLVK